MMNAIKIKLILTRNWKNDASAIKNKKKRRRNKFIIILFGVKIIIISFKIITGIQNPSPKPHSQNLFEIYI